MTKDYIERYRLKYPDDNFISDDDLIASSDYAYFAFHESAVDFGNAILEAIKPVIEKINSLFK